MSDDRQFPIHRSSMREEKWFPRSVPWNRLPAHANERAKSNHSQSLEMLAGRGGLSTEELWLVYHDLPLGYIYRMTPRQRIAALTLVLDLNEPAPSQPHHKEREEQGE